MASIGALDLTSARTPPLSRHGEAISPRGASRSIASVSNRSSIGVAGMDALSGELALFLTATFISALVAGLSGFAFGLVGASIWLYVLTPLQTTTLIVASGLIVQGYSVWKLRHALNWPNVWPFLLGAAFGVPTGVAILAYASPDRVRTGIGIVLIAYAAYTLFRPPLKLLVAGGKIADAGVGFLNGVLAGITGLAGILVIIWCGLRGWPKDQQRAVFQPVAVGIFAMTALWIGFQGAWTAEITRLFLFGLPVLLAGTWIGLKLYGYLDEARFRQVVVVCVLISGAVLILR